MRILLLTYSFVPNVGGVERSVADLAERLAREGHRVTVATHAFSAFPFRYRGGNPALLHLHIPSQAVPELGKRLVTALLNFVNGVILLVYAAFRRIDVVHGQHANADSIYGLWLARVLRIPFVLTLRGGETEEWIVGRPRRERYLRRLLAGADAVTAVSASLLEQAARLEPGVASRGQVIPNPTDAEALRPAAEGLPVRAGPDVLFAGRLEKMKDVAVLLEACQLAAEALGELDAELIVAGDGSLRQVLEARAREGGPAVRFVGSRSWEDALALVRDADLLVLPSRSSEGCPNVLLEAMALGTPVLVSDLPSLVEWVEDGVTGTVFKRGDAEDLARHLVACLAEPERAAARAHAARRRIDERHRYEDVVGRTVALYRSLASR